MDKRQVLSDLFDTQGIAIRRGAIFDRAPAPMGEGFSFDRAEGMLLGLAVGDALGNTSEGLSPAERQARYGEIRDYLPNRHAGGRRAGLPSDDTQLAFWTLEQMLADGEFLPDRVARRFCAGHIYGIGSTVRECIANLKAGAPWYKAGPRSAGNGALMRIAPMLVPHLPAGSQALWCDTALSAMITHNDAASTAACVAFVSMLWQLMGMQAPPPKWWPESYVAVARELEPPEASYRSNAPAYRGFTGPLWQFVEEAVGRAYELGLRTVQACNEWRSGAYLLETVPSALYILMRHGHDPEEAIVRAANDTWDNDTTAAIVGAAAGALHGKARLPERWVQGLLGRTGEADDGRVFGLLARARALWGTGDSRTSG